MNTDTTSNPDTLFRPVKRRKFLRRRPEDTQEETRIENGGADRDSNSTVSQSQVGDDPVHPANITRLRRLYRSRKGGIEFSATSRQSAENNKKLGVSVVTPEDIEAEKIQAMCDRFTAHTGQTVDVDKHMMAYIESEMAKRQRRTVPTNTTDSNIQLASEAGAASPATNLPQREPASLGKLHEIDLGQETKLQNIARTEAATRKLAGDEEEVHTRNNGFLSKAAPVGKDERLWSHRKRRTSEDVERDRLVEEVLRESKLDVYEEPELEAAAVGDDQAADDRVAEQFRRDFLDAIQSRRRVTRAKNTKTTKAEASRGPKLGGSRSARAAMREIQEKQGRK
ncbi:hepatocellular carcinoma-associated antigen 59-domain-containing protein [Aspergillus alliaceus]|uniref:Hepatocellular carcinoma-associated antigen 59-domain-containing protein n=1 Tax=Petromyces alliaceus TaxID=209559 RepID=A0A5N7C7F1_PETAA|nr:hepatocellular carcinoma-associated antigen 59-domain-containing protein [Aspergillus alliaceus]KAB8230564.1 hepatocellular carcinoma-associated antigen 59-domain-containing protein [Aspergillus alliaceus]KAE8390046.1 hepatocellular carcinoma-associated antigen 59-domain-containing protein [Aspergillus alliaceus]